MATRCRRVASVGIVVCIVAVIASAAPVATSGFQPSLEMAVEAGEVDFGEMSPASLPRTLQDVAYVAVKTHRTGPWNLTVRATGDFAAGEGGATFPIGNLEVAGRLNGQPASFQRCSTSPVTLVTNGPVSGGVVAMDYRLSVGYDAAVPANGAPYRSSLVYTTSYGMLAASYVDPSPFNPSIHPTVAIKYYYSRLAYPYVNVRITDSQGRVVYTRSFSRPPDGWYVETWDGRGSDGLVVPDGIYSYSITASIYIVAGGYIRVERSPRGISTHDSTDERRPGTFLQLSALARPVPAAVGDIVAIGVSLANTGPLDLADVKVTFVLPPGLRPVPETGLVEAGPGRRPAAWTTTAAGISWDLGTVERGTIAGLSFRAAVGPDAQLAGGVIRARASGTFGRLMVRSEEVCVPLVIQIGTGANRGAIVGRVFMDRDGDGGMGESDLPVQGIILAVDTGVTVRSDGNGGFVIEVPTPGDYVLRVAETSLPPGWKPMSTAVVVSIALGETARVDIPLRKADDGPRAGVVGSVVLSGTAVVEAEMSAGRTSWKVQGHAEATTQSGLEISLGGESGAIYMTDEGASELALFGPKPWSSGRARLAAPLGGSARLVVGLSSGRETSEGHPDVSVGMEVMPADGLKLAGGYGVRDGSPWVSGCWQGRLTDALTLSAGARISTMAAVPDGPRADMDDGESRGTGDGSEKLVLAPQVSVAYTGPSGVTGRLLMQGDLRLTAELAFPLPFCQGGGLSLAHRRSIGDAPHAGGSGGAADTVVGLWYSPRGGTGSPFTLAAQYEPDDRKLSGSLLLAGGAPGGGAYRVDLRACFGPRQETLSLKLGTALPDHLDAVAALALVGERRLIDGGVTAGKLEGILSCSFVLDERTTASGLLSVKRVDDATPPVPVRVTTRTLAAYIHRRVAPGLFLGAGGSWSHQDPGGVSVLGVDARAAYDIAAGARLVLGYRTALAAAGGSAAGHPQPPGPYVRLVLASGWDWEVPGLQSLD